MEKCKHGMRPEFCGQCRSPEPKASPISRDKPVHAKTGTLDQQHRALLAERARAEVVVHDDARASLETGYVRIFTQGGRNHHSFNDLDVRTRVVHINGHPYQWAIQKILERAPNVSVIELIPSMFEKVRDGQVRVLCDQRAVRLVAGHDRPDCAWAGTGTRDPNYDTRRGWILALQGERKARLEEILDMGIRAAVITARYFCLKGEEYAPQRVILQDFGYDPKINHIISDLVNATLYYLDPSRFGDVGNSAKGDAARIERRVEYLRPIRESAAERQRLVAELGIPYLPEKIPLAKLDTYRALIAACRDGRVNRLAQEHENAHCALALRYGLDKLNAPEFLTLEETGQLMKGITRERVRQLEERALAKLGIATDDE